MASIHVLRYRALAARALAAMLLIIIAGGIEAAPAKQSPAGKTSKQPAAPLVVPAYRQADHVAVLRVEGEIDSMTVKSLERRMAEAKAIGATAVVIDLDTPGGDAFAGLDICNLLKDRNETPANVVAWINPNAYSAGTYMALACREIVVHPNATMGDAAPIAIDQLQGLISLPPAERAKIESGFLAEVIDSARRHHYDENLVQAFVSVGVELWLIENKKTGDRAFVTREEYKRVFGEDPPEQVVSITPRASRVLPQFSLPPAGTVLPDGSVFDPDAIRNEIEGTQQLPSSRPVLTEADRDNWQFVTQVDSDDRLLTLKADEMLHYGLAMQTVANDDELKAYFGASTITRLDELWSEQLVRVLIDPYVRGFLILVMIIAGVIELHTPGFGLFGSIAVGTLLIIVGAPALAGMAVWWELALIGVGIVLVAVELFLLPGFGVAGVSGIACLLVGIVGTFVSGDVRTPQGQDELWVGIGTTLTALFLAGVAVWLISRQFESLPILNRFILQGDGSGSAASAEPTLLTAMGTAAESLAPGTIGRAETDLRPSGRASFGGKFFDVQATGAYISRGTPVRIVSVGRLVIEVEEAQA